MLKTQGPRGVSRAWGTKYKKAFARTTGADLDCAFVENALFSHANPWMRKFNRMEFELVARPGNEIQSVSRDIRGRQRRSGSRTSLGSRGKSLKLSTEQKTVIAMKEIERWEQRLSNFRYYLASAALSRNLRTCCCKIWPISGHLPSKSKGTAWQKSRRERWSLEKRRKPERPWSRVWPRQFSFMTARRIATVKRYARNPGLY